MSLEIIIQFFDVTKINQSVYKLGSSVYLELEQLFYAYVSLF